MQKNIQYSKYKSNNKKNYLDLTICGSEASISFDQA